MHHVPSTSQLCTTLCLVPENNTFLTPNFTFSTQNITFLPPSYSASGPDKNTSYTVKCMLCHQGLCLFVSLLWLCIGLSLL